MTALLESYDSLGSNWRSWLFVRYNIGCISVFAENYSLHGIPAVAMLLMSLLAIEGFVCPCFMKYHER